MFFVNDRKVRGKRGSMEPKRKVLGGWGVGEGVSWERVL